MEDKENTKIILAYICRIFCSITQNLWFYALWGSTPLSLKQPPPLHYVMGFGASRPRNVHSRTACRIAPTRCIIHYNSIIFKMFYEDLMPFTDYNICKGHFLSLRGCKNGTTPAKSFTKKRKTKSKRKILKTCTCQKGRIRRNVSAVRRKTPKGACRR